MNYSNRQNEDRSLKDLAPNVAGLLCYVGGWISGIVFLVLEQKNKFIRFHAIQSIIVFGLLSIAIAIFGQVPIVGGLLAGALGLLAFILWIILMIKALTGEYFKMPWAGDLADRLSSETLRQSTNPSPNQTGVSSNTRQANTDTQTAPSSPAPVDSHTTAEPKKRTGSAEKLSRADEFSDIYYSSSARSGRMIGHSFAIAWNVVLLVFFTFYNQYIAYYEPVHNGTTTWRIHTLITNEFTLWLPILTTTLVLGIIGHALLIAMDRNYLGKIVGIILDGFGAATVITLLIIFPFNFGVLPSTIGEDSATFGVTIFLVLLSTGLIIGAIVKFVQLIILLVEGKF